MVYMVFSVTARGYSVSAFSHHTYLYNLPYVRVFLWVSSLCSFLNVRLVKFQVVMAANMKSTAFWDIAPCRLVEVD
jgi:hypothetical protein